MDTPYVYSPGSVAQTHRNVATPPKVNGFIPRTGRNCQIRQLSPPPVGFQQASPSGLPACFSCQNGRIPDPKSTVWGGISIPARSRPGPPRSAPACRRAMSRICAGLGRGPWPSAAAGSVLVGGVLLPQLNQGLRQLGDIFELGAGIDRSQRERGDRDIHVGYPMHQPRAAPASQRSRVVQTVLGLLGLCLEGVDAPLRVLDLGLRCVNLRRGVRQQDCGVRP